MMIIDDDDKLVLLVYAAFMAGLTSYAKYN